MTDNTPYEALGAYLAGEASKEQTDMLLRWRDSSEENLRLFNEMIAAWGCCYADYATFAKSREKVLKKVISLSRRRRVIRPLIQAAAIIGAVAAGFLAATLIARIGEEKENSQIIASPVGEIMISTMRGQKSETLLPDGTRIWLNSGTSISYPADYGMESRQVTLNEGEAYLEVARSETLPFRLITNNGFIKVYGTSFDVRDYPEDANMTVTLKEGSIEHFSKSGVALAKLRPGQELTYHKSSGNMLLSECDAENQSVWRFGEMKIEKASFMDMILDMERWYGVDIKLTGHIPSRSLYWMTIKTESLREMLTLINKITPIDYDIDGKMVTIRVK